MKLSGFSLLRIGGIEIIIDYSWLVIFFLVIYTMSYFPQMNRHYAAPTYWIMGIVAAMLLLVSILIHELAHSFVATRFGIKVTSIRLLIFGGMEQLAQEPHN